MDPALLARLHAAHPAATRWVVAFSGGLDSHVLLDLCASYRREVPAAPPLVALHVDHGIHPDSPRWAAHCQAVSEALGVDCAVRHAGAGPVQSEDGLRRARYRAFEAFCVSGDLLLLAHHRDDQAETVLLRLVRGAGPAGLGGMPPERPCGAALLCRPLLEQPREALRAHAREHALQWLEDPANAAPRYGRNHLRHRVLPLLEERWPGVAERIARTAGHCAEAARVCSERAAEDIAACLHTDRFGHSGLRLATWRGLGADRASGVLREWLRAGGAGPVDAQVVDTLRRDVIDARADRQPHLVVDAVEVRRFDEVLYLLPVRPRGPAPAGFAIGPGLARAVDGVGRVALLPERAGGVRGGTDYRVEFRRPGMQCRLAGRPEKALKQVLQEAGVPPWLRDRVPLLFVDGEFAAVAGIGVCEGFEAAEGSEGVRLAWTPAAG